MKKNWLKKSLWRPGGYKGIPRGENRVFSVNDFVIISVNGVNFYEKSL